MLSHDTLLLLARSRHQSRGDRTEGHRYETTCRAWKNCQQGCAPLIRHHFVREPPQHYERHHVGGVLKVVDACASMLIELPRTRTTSKASVPQLGAGSSFTGLTRWTSHHPHPRGCGCLHLALTPLPCPFSFTTLSLYLRLAVLCGSL
jgi:hypothetical protein